MSPTTLYVLLAIVGLVVLVLARMCWVLWKAARSSSSHLHEYVARLQNDLDRVKQALVVREEAILQFGELLDHFGVDLERSPHTDAADGLKTIGHILRAHLIRPIAFFGQDWGHSQKALRELQVQYNVFLQKGDDEHFTQRHAIRIAEAIIEAVLVEQFPYGTAPAESAVAVVAPQPA